MKPNLLALLMCIATPAFAQPSAYDAALAAADRPAADRARDADRHPAALLDFAGIRRGEVVADIMPGKGYFTRIFSHVVGAGGHVYAITPSELAHEVPKMAAAIKALTAEPPYKNVSQIIVPVAAIAAPQKLDIAWTSNNYHDVYGFFGPAQAAAMDAAIFKALKPGGYFVVIDHVAAAGSSATSPTKLHRIDPETVKAQIQAAGFLLVGQSPLLANAADKHDKTVFDPAIHGHTDQFIFKFRKPIP